MSELFMECVEEDLEPWQKQVPHVHQIEDDDDEPIFVGVLSNKQKDSKPNPAAMKKLGTVKVMKYPPTLPTVGPSVLPLNAPVSKVTAALPTLTTVTPQPVIVNNQGLIVASSQISDNDLIATLGSQFPPGTSFTILPAPRQQVFQQITPAVPAAPGGVHRPQVQQISNNVVTLSNVQSPAVYSIQSGQQQTNRPNSQSLQTVFVKPAKDSSNNKDNVSVKRALMSQDVEDLAKKRKIDLSSAKVTVRVENGIKKKNCPKCHGEFSNEDALKFHIIRCYSNVGSQTPSVVKTAPNKLIMLVADFYYGRFEGDVHKKEGQKTNTTFKCQSCLKVLKNNIRFMNHMKHHLELEKQNSESWESHTTCQHCYRQYMTPFQLQCHIESAHSPIESSSNCKICELAFESEQVLLEHMKGNHKPGEMPYVCQVCNYRSSFFSDVETHFRSVHENTKDLLCPFCLKVIRSSHMYMQHYMKHQKKGIHRCGKCRLNFLTYKEKAEHRTHVHRTYRKPEALEGLPPGTKVTIRASLTGKGPSTPVCTGPSAEPQPSPQFKPPVSVFKIKPNDSKPGNSKMTQNTNKPDRNKKQNRLISRNNLSLKNLSIVGETHTCIECYTELDDLFSHFPMQTQCGACNYRTSCKVSIGNHMIQFHSAISKYRQLKMDNRRKSSGTAFTLNCPDCDLVDASGGDLMTKHLAEKPNHICRVQEKGILSSPQKSSQEQEQPS